MAALVAFLAFSFAGTVPINIQVIDWDVENAPAMWKSVVKRCKLLGVLRSAGATVAFALFLIAAARKVTGS